MYVILNTYRNLRTVSFTDFTIIISIIFKNNNLNV